MKILQIPLAQNLVGKYRMVIQNMSSHLAENLIKLGIPEPVETEIFTYETCVVVYKDTAVETLYISNVFCCKRCGQATKGHSGPWEIK